MTPPTEGHEAEGGRAPGPPCEERAGRRDYTGAVYGSLLAASVVATAETVIRYPRLTLVVMLLVTGLIFWVSHVYARLVGELLSNRPLTWQEVREVAAREWPIAEAAVPPAVTVGLCALLGLGLQATAWAALAVAVLEEVAWATLPAIRSGVSRRMLLVIGTANLLFGLVIVVAKAALTH